MIKRLFFLVVGLIIVFTGFSIPQIAQAADPTGGIIRRDVDKSGCLYEGGDFGDEDISERTGYVLTIDCVPLMIFNAVYWLLVFSGVVALFLIIFGGFKFMTSGGDQKAVEGGKKTITWAIIGLVVVLLSFGIVNFIAYVTGLSCITKFGLLGTCG